MTTGPTSGGSLIPKDGMERVRCRGCQRTLLEWDGRGRLEIVCPRCKQFNTYERRS